MPEPVNHPVIGPSVNAMAGTYRLAIERPELASTHSDIADVQVNRFLHGPVIPADLVEEHEMQSELGRGTGTCFQCYVGPAPLKSGHESLRVLAGVSQGKERSCGSYTGS